MKIKRILLIRLRLLGDIVLTIPTIQMLRKQYPDASISYIVEEAFEGIGRLLPGIDDLIVIPRKMGIGDMFRLGSQLKSKQFDILIDLHSGPKSSQIAFLSGISRRIGYRVPFRSWIYHHKLDRSQKPPYRHSVYNQARLLEGIGLSVRPAELPPYPPIEIDPDSISDELRGEIRRARKIVIHVGAGNAFRDWQSANYIQLSKRLKASGYSVFLIGHGQREFERGQAISDAVDVINCVGKLTIAESLYLIQHSDCYFGVDSGPLHLASLSSTPIVGIYGPNIPEISGPYRKEKIKILQRPMDCRPCDQRICIYDIKDDKMKCMKEISVDQVYEEIVKFSK